MPILILLFGISFSSRGQTAKIELLKDSISTAKSTGQRLAHIITLCEERQSLSTDTIFRYALLARSLASRDTSTKFKSLAEYNIAFCFARYERIDTALTIVNREIERLKGIQFLSDLHLEFNLLKARLLDRQNKYAEALTQLFEVLKNAEQLQNRAIQIATKNGIGWIQIEMEQPKEALKWFHAALKTSDDVSYLREYNAVYSNLATVYNTLGQNDSAKYYINVAIENARRSETLTFLATALHIQADIFMDLKQTADAEASFKEAIAIRKLINDPYYLAYDMSKLARFYLKTGRPEKGIEISKQGIDLALRSGLTSQLQLLYKVLAENYKATGDSKYYAETLDKLVALKDSLYDINSSKLLADLQNKFEEQKQEALISEQKFHLAKKQFQLYGLLLFVTCGAIIGWMIFRQYRRRQAMKMNYLLEQEKHRAQEAVKSAKEDERRRLAADLHDNLGAYASAISANVDELMKEGQIPGHHILDSMQNNAKEIMTTLRDTIWVLKKDSVSVTSISDRFKNYTTKIGRAYPHITVTINEQIVNDVAISPEDALHILHIMQEAFHNAIKHSRGSAILIEIRSDQNKFFAISDNGTGIMEESFSQGNGLGNMRARAMAMGWKLEIKKAHSQGTLVHLSSTAN